MDTQIDQNQITKFIQTLQQSEKIIIVPHVNPDGDAVGSSLGFCRILNNMGKEAKVIIPNEFPCFLKWIRGSDDVIDFEKSVPEVRELFRAADTLVVLDFNDFERSKNMRNLLSGFEGTKMMIDHHPDPVAPCDPSFSYPKVNSTCELIFRLVDRAGMLGYLDKDAADALFTGMMTDTGNFSYNASDPETYRIIAQLLEKGIDKDKIHSNVFHNYSEDRWRLIGHSLENRMVIIPEYRTGYITLSKADLDHFNFKSGDTEGLVNYPLMVKDIVFCVLFIENDDKVKISLRSKGSFSTNLFARAHFNGGGHNNASGGSTHLSLDEAVKKLTSLLPQYKTELLNSY